LIVKVILAIECIHAYTQDNFEELCIQINETCASQWAAMGPLANHMKQEKARIFLVA